MVMEDSLIITIAFIFSSAMVFSMLGFFSEIPRNLVGYIIAGVLWIVLGIVFPALTDLPYPHLSWAFILIGIVNIIAFLVNAVQTLALVYMDPWEKEEEWEEE
jgi:hypothetical protein